MIKRIGKKQTREELYLSIPKGGVGAELGVCKGSNAAILFQYTKPEKIYLVDIWTELCPDGQEWHPQLIPSYGNHYDMVSDIFSEEISSGRAEMVKEYSTDFLHKLENDSLDWVYLDSNHDYEVVSAEIEICLRKVKSGGRIMGHDYCNFMENTWGTSVVRAVNERIQSGDIFMEAISEDRWPSYLCRVL